MDDLKLRTPDFIFEASGTGVIITRVEMAEAISYQ